MVFLAPFVRVPGEFENTIHNQRFLNRCGSATGATRQPLVCFSGVTTIIETAASKLPGFERERLTPYTQDRMIAVTTNCVHLNFTSWACPAFSSTVTGPSIC